MEEAEEELQHEPEEIDDATGEVDSSPGDSKGDENNDVEGEGAEGAGGESVPADETGAGGQRITPGTPVAQSGCCGGN